MRLTVGPFDTVLHVRSRDHYLAICREAALLDLPPDSPPRRWEAAVGRLYTRLGLAPVTEVVDRAFQAGEPRFAADLTVPDEQVPAALETCLELDRLLSELPRWARQSDADVLSIPEDVHTYYAAFVAQARSQLEAASRG
jgi:hypothetical protein